MKMFLLSLALVVPLATPVSDVVPTWNVNKSCQDALVADKAENLVDAQTADACMRDESDARAELVKTWTAFSAKARTDCEAEANQGGLPSYVDLLVCLQINPDSAAKPTPTASTASMKGAGKHRKKAATK